MSELLRQWPSNGVKLYSMKSSEIIIGETYLFIGTESPTRQHLTGKPFQVTEKKRVWRRLKGKRANVYRFFNGAGEGARAEELEPIEKPICESWDVNELLPVCEGHPSNIQPGDYQEKDDLPF